MKCQFSNANSFTLTKYTYCKYLVIAGDGVYTLVFTHWCLVLPWQQGKYCSVLRERVLLVFDPLQVHFDPPPVFVSLPYSSTGVGGRRWRVWQSQLSSLGKVYPIILPDSLTDPTQGVSLTELAEQMVITSLGRVREVRGCEG